MDKSQFKNALATRKNAMTEILDEWVEDYLLSEAFSQEALGNNTLRLDASNIPQDNGVSLQLVAKYLKSKDFTLTVPASAVKVFPDFIIVGWE